MLFCEFAPIYMRQYSRPLKKTWKEDERTLKLYLLPAFGNKDMSEITRGDVARLHAEIGTRTPYRANRLKELLHTMYKKAIFWEFLPDGHRNPASQISDFKEHSRKRFLSEDEADRLIRAVSQEPNVYLRGAVLFLLLTGLRKSEVLELKWSYVKGDVLDIPSSKNGESIMQPLSEPAQMVLASLPIIPGNDFVFVGREKGRPLHCNLLRSWKRIRDRAKIDDLRIHDLRRTCGSWLTQDGCTLRVVQEVLNHKNVKSTLVYSRLNLNDKSKALDLHANKVSKLLKTAGLELSPIRPIEIALEEAIEKIPVELPKSDLRVSLLLEVEPKCLTEFKHLLNLMMDNGLVCRYQENNKWRHANGNSVKGFFRKNGVYVAPYSRGNKVAEREPDIMPEENTTSSEHDVSPRLSEKQQRIVESRIIKTLKDEHKTKKAMYRRIGGSIPVNKNELERVLAEMIEQKTIYEYREAPDWQYVRYGLVKK